MTERFHVNCSLGPGPVDLEGPEAHHLSAVCRLRPGDRVCLFNGDGQEYPALIEEVGRRVVHLRVLSVESPRRELSFRLEIAAPLPKGDRSQLLIEKLTELGVTAFVPLQTARSVITPRENKLEKLERQVIEASKQCRRNVLMEVGPLTPWKSFCASCQSPLKLLAHPGGGPLGQIEIGKDVTAAVGPEGGFTDEEVELARSAGWRLVDLGPRILRIETAALALAGWLMLTS